MAAIYGVHGKLDKNLQDKLHAVLCHRGTDHLCLEIGPNVALGWIGFGHPNVYQSGRYAVVADSSIYNRSELLLLLKQSGYEAKTETDAEVFAALYDRHGISGVDRINGDYAFAIWDDAEKRCLIGRDYLGSRPLYYTHIQGSHTLFASEYKAFYCFPAFRPDADQDMIQHLQHCKHLPNGRTLLKNVAAFPTAGVCRIDADGRVSGVEKQEFIGLNIDDGSAEDKCREILEALLSAVEARAGNGKVGVALSGGIDSVSVAGAYRRVFADRTIHTFTAGQGGDDPDIDGARRAAEALKTEHHEIIVTAEDIKGSIEDIVWHMEDPIARSETVQLYKIGQAAQGTVDTLLAGLIADGLFAGMPKHKLLWLMKRFPMVAAPVGEFLNFTQTGVKPRSLLGKCLESVYFRDGIAAVPMIRNSAYSPKLADFPQNRLEFVNQVLVSGYQNGVPTWLPKVERNLAASGVGYASPFFDKRMIKIAFSIGDSLKIRNWKEKFILRQAVKGIVPPELLNRKKRPQIMKHDEGFSGMLEELASNYLSPEAVRRRNLFFPEQVEQMMRRPAGKSYPSETAMRIWTAVLTEIWAQTFLDLKGRMAAVGVS